MTFGDRSFLHNPIVVTSYRDEPFSAPGDSGAVVMDEAGRCVGMVIGGAYIDFEYFTYCVPFARVARKLGLPVVEAAMFADET